MEGGDLSPSSFKLWKPCGSGARHSKLPSCAFLSLDRSGQEIVALSPCFAFAHPCGVPPAGSSAPCITGSSRNSSNIAPLTLAFCLPSTPVMANGVFPYFPPH